MPSIKAFRGIRPDAMHVNHVIAKPAETPFSEHLREQLSNNKKSILHLVEPELENTFLRGSKQELIHKKITENLQDFLEKGILVRDNVPSIYIYRISKANQIQTGIWTVTLIDDYINNKVKKHEHTRADRERNLAEYLQQTGIDANPVLVTYPSDEVLNSVLNKACSEPHLFDFYSEGAWHQLWAISDPTDIKTIIDRFAEMPGAYIADGHHRAAAFSTLGIERRKNNLRHKGTEEYNFFSSIYFSAEQLQILTFHRLVKDLNGLSEDDFWAKIKALGTLVKSEQDVIPTSKFEFGIYFKNKWYKLTINKEFIHYNDPVKQLDVSILQSLILENILGISDPRTNTRIDFMGDIYGIDKFKNRIDNGEMAIGFTVFPTSIEELFAVADEGEVMPPKSTWFEPKLHLGIVIHNID